MSEFHREQQEALISEREVMEGLSPMELKAFIAHGCAKMSEIERMVHLANDVLENGYGIPENVILATE